MSETLLEQILAYVVRLALVAFGESRTQAIIRAELDAVDVAMDELENRKFPK